MRQNGLVGDFEVLMRKKELFEKWKVDIVKVKVKVVIVNSSFEDDGMLCVLYMIYFEYLCKEQDGYFYLEEQIEEWIVFFYDQLLIKDWEVKKKLVGFFDGNSVIEYEWSEWEDFGRVF